MKTKEQKNLVFFGVGVGLLASVTMLPLARGELVYDMQQAAPSPRAEEREGLRQVLQTSQKAQTTVQVETQAIPAIEPQTVASTTVEVQNVSKSELMRRERVREELKNEDILQERLEELRLRDERRRAEQLFTGETAAQNSPEMPAMPTIKEEVVVAPVTEKAEPVVPVVTSVSTPVVSSTSTEEQTKYVPSGMEENRLAMTVMPRGGLANMTSATGFNISGRYSTGIGFGVGVSENVSFDLGYQFSEYGVAMASSNPFVQYAMSLNQGYGYNPTFETIAMKQNVVDAGLKLHFLGSDAKLRPFIGGGGAYSKSFVNYDVRILDTLNRMGFRYPSADYEMSSFLGYLSAGLDVRLSKSISIGAVGKYYAVLTARENQPLNNAAFYYNQGLTYQPGALVGYPGYYNTYDEKQVLGGSLLRAGFYSVLLGVSFSL